MEALYRHSLFVPCLLIWAIALPLLTIRTPQVTVIPEPLPMIVEAPPKPKDKPKNKPPGSFLPPPPPRLTVPAELPPIGKFPRE